MEQQKMNKLLLVENINKIPTGTYHISYPKNTTILSSGNINLFDYNNNVNLNIDLEDKTNLNYEKVNILTKDLSLNINIHNHSQVDFNWLIISTGKVTVNLTINMLGNSSKCHVKIRAINKKSNDNLNIIFDGQVSSCTIENELLENIKGLLPNNSSIKISPNMLINTNEVMANHLVTIGSFNSEELFYLMSKGLTYQKSCELLVTSFLTSNINSEFQKLIKTEVINIE